MADKTLASIGRLHFPTSYVPPTDLSGFVSNRFERLILWETLISMPFSKHSSTKVRRGQLKTFTLGLFAILHFSVAILESVTLSH